MHTDATSNTRCHDSPTSTGDDSRGIEMLNYSNNIGLGAMTHADVCVCVCMCVCVCGGGGLLEGDIVWVERYQGREKRKIGGGKGGHWG